ncbi:3-hydroxy-3-methylglutaryl-coenzyme A (HMG-CoA) reductase isozyme, partial [Borealophlyctis nickersoniae]
KVLKDYVRAVRIRRVLVGRTTKNDIPSSLLPVDHYDYSKVLGVCCENVIRPVVESDDDDSANGLGGYAGAEGAGISSPPRIDFDDEEVGVPTLAPPPPEGTTEHVFVDTNVIRYYCKGRYPLLNAFLRHPRRKIYYSPTVRKEIPQTLTKLPKIFRFFKSSYASSRVEEMFEIIAEHARSDPDTLETIREDLTIIGEVAVSIPGEFNVETDKPPYLLSTNMTLFRAFLANEYNARVTAYAVEQAGLDHLRRLMWAQDLGILYDLDFGRIQQAISDGPYASTKIDLTDVQRYRGFYKHMVRECRLPADVEVDLNDLNAFTWPSDLDD